MPWNYHFVNLLQPYQQLKKQKIPVAFTIRMIKPLIMKIVNQRQLHKAKIEIGTA